jgi:hypothetical protein
VAVGVSVFVTMMVGVGGYQAAASPQVRAFMLGVDPDPVGVSSAGPVAGSALSMCAQSPDTDTSSSFVTVHAASWRDSMSMKSKHSPTGLLSVCD